VHQPVLVDPHIDKGAECGDVRHDTFENHVGLQILELLHALSEVRRLESRARIASWLLEFPQDVCDGRHFDVLLTPVAATAAFPHNANPNRDERTVMVNGKSAPYAEQLFFAGLASLSSLPATAAPIGLTEEGLHVGLQIIGPEDEDPTTIEFARLHAAERKIPARREFRQFRKRGTGSSNPFPSSGESIANLTSGANPPGPAGPVWTASCRIPDLQILCRCESLTLDTRFAGRL
jgi:hypothetical protein